MGAGKTDIAIGQHYEKSRNLNINSYERRFKNYPGQPTKSHKIRLSFNLCPNKSITGLCRFKFLFQQFENTIFEPTSHLKLSGICIRGSLKVFLE
jgi:hypothetical protein